MFLLIGFLFFILGCLPLIYMAWKWRRLEDDQRSKWIKISIVSIVADIVIIAMFNAFCHYYTEMLWFDALGYLERFWTEIKVKILWFFIGLGASFLFLFAVTRTMIRRLWPDSGTGVVSFVVALGLGVLFGIWAGSCWENILLYLNQVTSPVNDPIFGKSVSFYMFPCPCTTPSGGGYLSFCSPVS